MKRFAGLFLVFLATQVATPAAAEAFSAQDVMSVCVTTPRDPEEVPEILRTLGWIDVPEAEKRTYREALTVANIASYLGGFSIHGSDARPEEWKTEWQALQSQPGYGYIGDRGTLLRHEETGALLLFTDFSSKLALNYHCLLTVLQAELKRSSYFPKLRAPVAPSLSLGTTEHFSSDSVRSTFALRSSSLDTEGINKLLNIKTEVGAVFESSVKYPKMAVTP